MSTVTLNFEDKQLALLHAKAKELQLSSVEELLLKVATELLETPETKFEAAMQYVLEKNKKLYERLA